MCCCVMQCVSQEATNSFCQLYDHVLWRDRIVLESDARCTVRAYAIDGGPVKKYLTNREKKSSPDPLGDLHPPSALPQGNIGTPDADIVHAIRQCRLPRAAVAQLGFDGKRLPHVGVCIPPPDYRTSSAQEEEEVAPTPASLPFRRRFTPKTNIRERCSDDPEPQPHEVQASQPSAATNSADHLSYTEEGRRTLEARRLRKRKQRFNAQKACSSRASEECEGEGHIYLDDVEDWELSLAQTGGLPDVHYEKSNRIDSQAGYLHEDRVDRPWDKGDASGLVHYTDACLWDELADHDGLNDFEEWGVEWTGDNKKYRPERWVETPTIEEANTKRRKHDWSHFDKFVVKGVAGNILRDMGWTEGLAKQAAKSQGRQLPTVGSQVFCDVIEPLSSIPQTGQGLGYHAPSVEGEPPPRDKQGFYRASQNKRVDFIAGDMLAIGT